MRDEWKKHDEQDRRAQSATPAQHPFERQEDDSVGQRGCCDLDALQDLHAVAEERTRKIAHRKGEVLASPDVELTAVCTTRPESAEEARAAFGAQLAFHDFRTMVASPEVDAVAVVVRVPSHYEPTRAAIEAGKHVYTEWPLGRTTAEAEELAALARSRGCRRGRTASAGQPYAHVHEGADRGRVCGRGAVLSRHLDA